jgi:oligosaccharide repeat unit polymerase
MMKWVLLSLIVSVPYLMRRKSEFLLHPMIVLSWLWGLIMLITFLSRFSDSVSQRCIVFVTAFLAAFCLGSVIQAWMSSKRRQQTEFKSIVFPFRSLSLAVMLFSLIGFCAPLNMVLDYRDVLCSDHIMTAWKHITSAEATRAYAGVRRPLYFSLLVAAIYAGSLLGGLHCAHAARYRVSIGLVPILPALLYSFLTTMKAFSVLAMLFWLSSFYTAQVTKSRGRYKILSKTNMLVGFTICLSTLCFLMVIQGVRYGQIHTASEIVNNLYGLYDYPAAILPPLCKWVHRTDWWGLVPDLGRWTFPGIFDFLGLAPREVGIYSDKVTIRGYDSNLFSAIRGLIMDFTLPGAILITFLGGVLSNHVFEKTLKSQKWAMGLLPMIYGWILFSPVVSVFSYNSITLSLVIFFAFVVTFGQYESGQSSDVERTLGERDHIFRPALERNQKDGKIRGLHGLREGKAYNGGLPSH